MTELLLSSQRLENFKVLQTGQLDVFEALKKHADLENILMETEVPKTSVLLEWKEVQTPNVPASIKDLAGKKLTEYKFQYLGQFTYKDKIIKVDGERFIANFPNENISNSEIQCTGWLNCTWLIDFLVNGTKIQEDALREECLTWRKNKKERFLCLSRESIDKRHKEQEQFIFSAAFDAITWEHNILFCGQEVC